jgi:hypothetical protein
MPRDPCAVTRLPPINHAVQQHGNSARPRKSSPPRNWPLDRFRTGKDRKLIGELGLEEPTYADARKDGYADGRASGFRDGYAAASQECEAHPTLWFVGSGGRYLPGCNAALLP